MVVPLQSSHSVREGALLSKFPCVEDIRLLSWIQTGIPRVKVVGWDFEQQETDDFRSPFNDSIIASGSDDGKVCVPAFPFSVCKLRCCTKGVHLENPREFHPRVRW